MSNSEQKRTATSKWFIGLSVTAIAAIAVLIVAAAPYSKKNSCCPFCGRDRQEVWMFGMKVYDKIHVNECSAWVDGIHPNHLNHVWSLATVVNKSWGFNEHGDGYGAGGLKFIYRLRNQLGETRARVLLEKYHAQLIIEPFSLESLQQFLRKEVYPLLDTNAYRTSAP
jgi:hypothetical protein